VHFLRAALQEEPKEHNVPHDQLIARTVAPASYVPAPIPEDEAERLADLYAYAILDSDPDEAFEDIVSVAAFICGTSWARVTFVDAQRQWTHAVLGMDGDDMPRDEAFCPHTIVAPGGVMVINDAFEDERFRNNPYVLGDPHIRFYAGSAIRAASGRPVGVVCVLDPEPRDFDADQLEALERLSRLASRQLELRRLLNKERDLVSELRDVDRRKAEFQASVAHDFLTPLTSIKGYTELLCEGETEPAVALEVIGRATDQLIKLLDNIGGDQRFAPEALDLRELARATIGLVQPAAEANGVEIGLLGKATPVVGDAHLLALVTDNLIGNAVKYSPGATVEVEVFANGDYAGIEVRDTGVGIPAADLERVFERRYRASTSAGIEGTGLGLAVVREIVEQHGGTVAAEPNPGGGTIFRATVLRRAIGEATGRPS
jgi:signal transduction histidine kinase